MKQSCLFISILILLIHTIVLPERMQPTLQDGRYYNELNERNYFFDALKIVAFKTCSFPLKLFSRSTSKKSIEAAEKWEVPLSCPQQCDNIAITWIGHATVLIQIAGVNILTDPVCGEIGFPFPQRCGDPVNLNQLPHIDVVLISHNHKDHTNEQTLKELALENQPLVLVPIGDKDLFHSYGFKNVTEKSWWESIEMIRNKQRFNFTFLPARHWSCRSYADRNKSLWGSWMISHDDSYIYFGGDTAYGKHFAQISEEFPHIDVALLPIAPIEPYFLTKHTHMNALDAVQSFIDLNAQYFIPIHWGTFETEQFNETLAQLKKGWQQQKTPLQPKSCNVLKRCESLYLDTSFD